MTCKEKILSNDYADFINDYILARNLEGEDPLDYCYHAIDSGFGVSNVNRSQIPPLSLGYYGYASIPNLYGLMQVSNVVFDPESLASTGSIRVQKPPLSLKGRGVILGFIDTGIRYTLDVFRREDGSSRIMSIWDQTIQDGEPPEDFLYGTEYTRAQIDSAIQSDNPYEIVPSRDVNGHGTQMASVAAGSILNEGLVFRGAAPEADIAVVKLKGAKEYLRNYYLVADEAEAYQENDIMEAVRYLERMAIAFSRPVVIVLGLGTSLGSHDGTSPLATYLDYVARRRSRAVVVCGGNEGAQGHHYAGVTPDSVEIRVAERMKGFCMELWGSLPNSYTVTVRSPGGEVSTEFDFRNGPNQQASFIFEQARVTVGIVPVEANAGDELIFMRFDNPTQGIWTVQVNSPDRNENVQGTYHMWLPIEQFLERSVTFLASDPNVTLTEPANTESVITISGYNSDTKSWYPESSRGYTRSGMVKPDLSAPGVRVPTALGEGTGSSIAAAMAGGCVAQFLEWAIVDGNAHIMESRSIRSYLIRGADRDNSIRYPDRRWGFGTININGTFETLARM